MRDFLLSIGLVNLEDVMDQVVVTTPVVRCIAWREESAQVSTILFQRKQVKLSDDRGSFMASHWDLPLGKKLKRESVVDAAERVLYDSAGVFAEKAQVLRQFPLQFSNVTFRPEHYYVSMSEISGRFDQDDYEKSREGVWQWIPVDLLSCYAIRKETLAMISSAEELR